MTTAPSVLGTSTMRSGRDLVDGHNSASDLDAANYSIHMHVWTQAEFLELLLHCRRRFADSFEIEAFARRSLEVVVVLRKAGELAEMVGLPPRATPPRPRPRPPMPR